MQTSQQIKDIYRKLPQKMRAIIVSPELGEIIEVITKNNGLTREQHDVVVKAMNDFLLGTNTKENILLTFVNDAGMDSLLSQKLFIDIENKIFNNLDNIYTKIIKNEEEEGIEIIIKTTETQEPPIIQSQTTPPKPTQNNNVGQSFEQIILNQAKAMQPARPKDETGRDTSNEVRSTIGKNEPPNNLPIEKSLENKPKITVSDYHRSDPYREPTE